MSPAAAPKILALMAKCLDNLLSRLVGHLAKEAQQCGVYFFRVCPRDAVWAVLHDELARAFDELGGAESRSGDGKDAVGISVNHKRGYIDTGQILAEVFVPHSDTRQQTLRANVGVRLSGKGEMPGLQLFRMVGPCGLEPQTSTVSR